MTADNARRTARRPEHFHAHSYFQWVPVFRDYPLPPSVKLVGLTLATYATAKDGRDVHPGFDLLMTATGYGSRTTVTKALETLRELGFIHRTYSARKSGGRSRLADEYQLTLHNGLRREAGHKPCDCPNA